MKKSILLPCLFLMNGLLFAQTKEDKTVVVAPVNEPVVIATASAKAPAEPAVVPAEDLDDIGNPFESGFDSAEDLPAPMVAELPPAVLQGLAMGADKATVVINGVTYVKGVPKDGIEIVEVRKKEADIIHNGVPRTLTLIPRKKKAAEEKKDDGEFGDSFDVGEEDASIQTGQPVDDTTMEDVK